MPAASRQVLEAAAPSSGQRGVARAAYGAAPGRKRRAGRPVRRARRGGAAGRRGGHAAHRAQLPPARDGGRVSDGGRRGVGGAEGCV